MIGILANQKGGVAKTTNTVHLGASLANKGFKTLLIDFDSQCDLSHNIGVNISDDEYNVIDLLENSKEFSPLERAPNLFVVAGSLDFISNAYAINILKQVLEKDRNGFSIKNYFDFILIDCPPSKISNLSASKKYNHSEIELALFASDFFMIPLKADDFSVKNANTFLGKATDFIKGNKLDIQFLGFFFSCILLTENSLEYYTDMFKKSSSDLLLDSFIRQDAEVKKAVQLGKTIFQHKPTCRAAEDYIMLTNEFLNIIKK
tara:strand:- start:2054 stop:2836 length:783 start_codon:yes stop_codon:yes gene_type:complete